MRPGERRFRQGRFLKRTLRRRRKTHPAPGPQLSFPVSMLTGPDDWSRRRLKLSGSRIEVYDQKKTVQWQQPIRGVYGMVQDPLAPRQFSVVTVQHHLFEGEDEPQVARILTGFASLVLGTTSVSTGPATRSVVLCSDRLTQLLLGARAAPAAAARPGSGPGSVVSPALATCPHCGQSLPGLPEAGTPTSLPLSSQPLSPPVVLPTGGMVVPAAGLVVPTAGALGLPPLAPLPGATAAGPPQVPVRTVRRIKPVGLDDFRFLSQLGRGAFGVVWYAEKVSTGRRYALKLVDKRGLVRAGLVAPCQHRAQRPGGDPLAVHCGGCTMRSSSAGTWRWR